MDSEELYSSLETEIPEGEGSANGEQDPTPSQASLLVRGLLTFLVSFLCFLKATEGQEGERKQRYL